MNQKYLLWFYLKNRVKKETSPSDEIVSNVVIDNDLPNSRSQQNSEEASSSASGYIDDNGSTEIATKNKIEMAIMIGIVISLLCYLTLTISMLFFGDEFWTRLFYFVSILFMTVMLVVMHFYDSIYMKKKVDKLLVKYVINMQYLHKQFEGIGVDIPELYDHVISIIEKKSNDMNKSREKILSYTGKFLTFVFFPIVAFVFSNFKMDWSSATSEELISILTSLLLFAIGIFVFYIIFLILVNMKWQKESDMERMINDLTWIKIKLSRLSE